MEHCGTVTLETERLLLRRFTLADAEPMFRNWASDREVTTFLTWPAHADVEVTKQVLRGWVSSYPNERFYQWAIVPKKNADEPIGSISVVALREDIAMAEIGYCIGRAWWNRGCTSEALKAVMDFMFDRVGANRVQADHDTRNPHSGLVMQKCGMKYEGTMRGAARNNQGICDIRCYAMLRSDRE